MSRITWDNVGERTYETGVDHGVLYPQKNGKYEGGVAWNGLISVSENPSGAEDNALYADNIKYLNIKSAEELGLTVECYTYPDEWLECDGSAIIAPGVLVGQQKRNTFGLCYRTKVGNDTEGEDHGYKLHLVYGCSASPSERSYQTVNDSPEAITFSYDVTTTPVPMTGYKPVALLTIDTSKVKDLELMANLEKILYGDEENEPRLPFPDEVSEIFKVA